MNQVEFDFAKKVSEVLDVPLGNILVKQTADGFRVVRLRPDGLLGIKEGEFTTEEKTIIHEIQQKRQDVP